ncbi:MAG: thioesterase family protein [Acidimicrobiales bacterium]
MSGFSADTAVRRVPPADGDPAGSLAYAGEIAHGWDIAGNANGGYLLALAGRAMAAACNRERPVSLTAHYLSPARPGPVAVDCTVAKSGRAHATVQATMTAGDAPVLALVGTFTSLSETGDELLVDAMPSDLAPIDDCVRVEHDPEAGFPPPFVTKVVQHLHPDDVPFRKERSGRALMRGWFSLPDDEPLDPFALLLAADAFPPTVFNTDLPVAWVPTVELTVHVRAVPAPGPIACRFTTRFVTGGRLEADGELWDSAGRLVAQSRQLALVPRG